MTKRVVEHEIKLEKSVKVILGVLALGVLLNAFAPAFSVREAFANFNANLGTSSKFDSYSLINSFEIFDISDWKSTKTLSISMLSLIHI